MGEPQRPQTIGSTLYTLAMRRAYPGGHRHAALRSTEQTERSGSWFSFSLVGIWRIKVLVLPTIRRKCCHVRLIGPLASGYGEEYSP